MSQSEKDIYVEYVTGSKFERRRSAGGWYERVFKDVAMVPAAPVGSVTGSSSDSAPVGTPDAELAPVVTPKKRNKICSRDLATRMFGCIKNEMKNESPEKIAMRKLLTAVADGDRSMKQSLSRRLGPWRLLKKPAGRPCGSCKVSDEQIIEALKTHSAPVPEILESTGTEIRMLDKSKRRCAKATGILKKSQLSKRLRLCSLGFI